MKYSHLLIIIFCCFPSFSQEESDKLLPWDEVETKPVFPGCENSENPETCSREAFIDFIREEFDMESLPDSLSYHLLNFKIIIGTDGRLRWSSVQANHPAVKNEAQRILKILPVYTPGLENDSPVNVITDFGINLKKPPGIIPLVDAEIPPVPRACVNTENKRECISKFISTYINYNFNTDIVRSTKAVFRTEVNFIIDQNGEIANVTATGDHDKMNREAIRLVKKLDLMIPARSNGKPVAVSLNLPIQITHSR